MALKINAGEDVKRGDLFMVDPFQVVVKEDLRGRHLPPSDEVIIDMAMSMMEHGQRQPVECRKVEGNKLLLVLGFTRTAAARLIRTGFVNPETGEEVKDEEFKLKCVITDANDQKAFLNNIVENAHRNQTSPMDDAYNQHRLRDQYGYSDADVRRLFQYKDVNKVGRLRRLLSLPKQAQLLVHEERLPVQAALDILDIEDETARNEAFEKVYAECEANGKTKASDVRSLVRQHHLNDDDKEDDGSDGESKEGSRKSKTKPLSSKEMRKFWENLSLTHADDAVKALANTVVLWMGGKRADKTLQKAIDAVLDAERS
jgi:ParB-like chromosome segregation protein Spo0J